MATESLAGRLATLLVYLLPTLYKRTSAVIAMDLIFAEWGWMFGAAKMTTTLLDRLTHHYHIIGSGNES